MRNLFKEKYMGSIIMYEEMLEKYIYCDIFIFLYRTLLSRLKIIFMTPQSYKNIYRNFCQVSWSDT